MSALSPLSNEPMKSQACLPCFKRKVRCDRKEPCSNCSRRTQDRCVYPELSPSDRIRKLEAIIRDLGGHPDIEPNVGSVKQNEPSNPSSHSLRPQKSRAITDGDCTASKQGSQAIILNEDGEQVYLESRSWHPYDWKPQQGPTQDDRYLSHQETFINGPARTSTGPRALQHILHTPSSADLVRGHPSRFDQDVLWNAFFRNVSPVFKISCDRELKRLRTASTSRSASLYELSPQEHALTFAIYLISAGSLTESEALSLGIKPRTALLTHFRMFCEQALACSNFLSTSDLGVIEAMTLYLAAGLNRISTRSLWGMMGIVIRNAERSGIHRDGTLLGLSPYVTERRRRLWWQLQHVDVALSVKSGSTSSNIMAGWDTLMPLNIEDTDLRPEAKEPPVERKGLTSMSYCLWTFWVIREQRAFFHEARGRFGLSWASDPAVAQSAKDTLLQRLETGLNEQFLQFCDPINPIHLLTQLCVRTFICAMKRHMLHPLAQKISRIPNQHRGDLLEVCMQCLRYDIALHSHHSLGNFQWRIDGFFQWAALIFLVAEVMHGPDLGRADEIWALLGELYTSNKGLHDLAADRRKAHAAELIVLAWKMTEDRLSCAQASLGAKRTIPRPRFLHHLEQLLLTGDKDAPEEPCPEGERGEDLATNCSEGLSSNEPEASKGSRNMAQVTDFLDGDGFGGIIAGGMLNFDPDDIDWSFWEHHE